MCQNRNILVKFNYSKDSLQYQFNLLIIDSNSLDASTFIIPEKYDDKIVYTDKELDILVEKLDFLNENSSEFSDKIDENNSVIFDLSEKDKIKNYKFSFPKHPTALFGFLFWLSKKNKSNFPSVIIKSLSLDELYSKWLEDRFFNMYIYVYFSYDKKKTSNHNLILSTFSSYLPILDTNILKEPLASICLEQVYKNFDISNNPLLWEIPEDYTVNSGILKYLDSLISNNKLPYIQNCNEKRKNEKHLVISFYDKKNSENYSNCIYYGKNYSNVYEFCYLLESIKAPDYFWTFSTATAHEWVLLNFANEESFNYETAVEMYLKWKKENKKE